MPASGRPSHVAAHAIRQYARSLKGRLVALSLGLSVALVWVLVLFASTVLRDQITSILFDQQFASVQRLAIDLSNKLEERISMLAVAEDSIVRISEPHIHAQLQQFTALHRVFSGGIQVVGLDGRTISDYPPVPGRRGAYFGDRTWISEVVRTGKPYISAPVQGRVLNRPLQGIAVPVHNAAGRKVAVLAGITDLTQPNFFGFVFQEGMAGKGELSVISPADKLILAATNPTHFMTPTAPRGAIPMLDRFMDGFEGSGLANNSHGDLTLYSAARVPATNWLVVAALPAEDVLRPAGDMRNYLIGVAVILTIVAAFLAHGFAGRVLVPLDDAGRAIRRLREGSALPPAAVEKKNEIDGLIQDVSVLVEDRERREAALVESEYRFKSLVENAPDAIAVEIQGVFAYVNSAAMSLLAAKAKHELLGQPILAYVDSDARPMVEELIRSVHDDGKNVPPIELMVVRLDGATAYVEVSAIPISYEKEKGGLIFARDITARKRAEQALLDSHARIRDLAAHQEHVKEVERKRIARDIHDDLGQRLLTMRIDALLLSASAAESYPTLQERVAVMLDHIDSAIKSVKSAVNDLRPSVLDLGLLAAIEWHARKFEQQSGIQCEIEVSDEEFDRLLDERRCSSLFRVVQESLTNVLRHAKATHVRISFQAEDMLLMKIEDNGIGLSPASREKKNSFGLVGIEERVAALGGAFKVESAPGEGTTLVVCVPLSPREHISTVEISIPTAPAVRTETAV